MTYDRGVTRLSAESVAANRRVYETGPRIRHVAVHAHQNRGGQVIDVGIVDVIEK